MTTIEEALTLGRGIERFWSYVDQSGECWLWTRGLVYGYGRFTDQGVETRAHRYAYELVVGPIPAGLDLDHLCHNADVECAGGVNCVHRRCVRPDHLQPATRRENLSRSIHGNAAKRCCPAGHEYTEENTYRHGGQRFCRTCHREEARRRRHERSHP